jgi:hypothetical protein
MIEKRAHLDCRVAFGSSRVTVDGGAEFVQPQHRCHPGESRDLWAAFPPPRPIFAPQYRAICFARRHEDTKKKKEQSGGARRLRVFV